MYIWFFISALGLIATVPVHFLSVEHTKLQEKYGKEKGTKIGDGLGLISGWGFFAFWMAIWIAPQPRFTIPILPNLSGVVPVIDLSIPFLHLMICIPFLVVGPWIAIKGVRATTLKAAELHRTERIVTTGVYTIVRHPQYLGGLLAHVGISLLLSAWYSLLLTPTLVLLIYLLSRKEEKELVTEFGKEYVDYKKQVPMLMPRLRSRQQERARRPVQ